MIAEPGAAADSGRPPRVVILAAVTLAVAAIGGVLVIAALREAPSPVTVPAVPTPQAGGPACRSLSAALPQRLGDYRRVAISQPAPAGAAAWRAGPDGQPVVLRCGLDRPADFVVGSPIQVVDRVQWFQVPAGRQPVGNPGESTWCTVDRPVYVALTLPSGSGSTPIQQLSDVIDRTLAAVPIDPAAPR